METYGGSCKSAVDLINDIAIFAYSHESAWTREEIVTNLKASIALSLQRGNAHAVVIGHRACTQAA